MTVKEVLKKNPNVSILDDGFRIFSVPYNNFIVYTDGKVYLRTDATGDYKSAVSSTEEILSKLPPSMPSCINGQWTFSYNLLDYEEEELTKFLSAVYDAIQN